MDEMILYYWATGYFSASYWATGYWQYLSAPRSMHGNRDLYGVFERMTGLTNDRLISNMAFRQTEYIEDRSTRIVAARSINILSTHTTEYLRARQIHSISSRKTGKVGVNGN